MWEWSSIKKTTALNRIFYYSVPAELADQVHLGQIVEVDFAHQRLEAIVVEAADAVDWPPEKLSLCAGLSVRSRCLARICWLFPALRRNITCAAGLVCCRQCCRRGCI